MLLLDAALSTLYVSVAFSNLYSCDDEAFGERYEVTDPNNINKRLCSSGQSSFFVCSLFYYSVLSTILYSNLPASVVVFLKNLYICIEFGSNWSQSTYLTKVFSF